MDLDGLAGVTLDEPNIVWGMTALCYLEGMSVIVLSDDGLGEALRNTAGWPDEFEAFCAFAAQNITPVREIMEQLARDTLRSHWMNAPPLLRMMRSHWFWAWYETVQILRLATSPEASAVYLRSGDAELSLPYEVAAVSDGRILISGPSRLNVGETELRHALQRFNNIIDKYWLIAERGPEGDGPLFSDEQLLRHAMARLQTDRAILGGPENRAALKSALRIFTSMIDAEQTLADVAETAVLISTDAALRSFGQSDIIHHCLIRRFPWIAQTASHDEAPTQDHDLPDGLVRFIHHREQTGLLGWNQYFHESSALFNDWLARNSYLSIAPHVFDENNDARPLWIQICRFLSGLFLSSEVTIYRYGVSEPYSPLVTVASYFQHDPSPEELDARTRVMIEAASDERKRDRSISYRAADENSTRYVPNVDGVDEEPILSATMRTGEWARSVLAIPIRLNGGVWGVVEFVSTRPHHYGALLRAKCEEIAATLSTSFLLNNVFGTLGRLDEYWSDEFTSDRGRRGELCHALSNIFMSDALSVFVGSQTAEGTIFGLEEFGSWSDADENARRSIKVSVDISKVRSFLESNANVKEVASFDGEDTVSTRRLFLVRLRAHRSMEWAGALAFSTPGPIRVDTDWRQTTFAMAQIVAGVISNVSSDASWNKEARRDLRHEYLRILEAIVGVSSRLSGINSRLIPMLDGGDRSSLERLPEDLDDIAGSLQDISEALLADVYDRLVQGDRRLISVRKAQEIYRAGPQHPVSVRDVFNRRFRNAANAAPDKNLRIVINPTERERLVRMPDRTLSDILGTLADNAVKYSIQGGEIHLTFSTGAGGAFVARISNLGPALEPDEVAHIFDDGFRGKAARQIQPKRGSGLGLKYARGAIELWNGWLRYKPDEQSTGTRFIDGRRIVWHRFSLLFPEEILADR